MIMFGIGNADSVKNLHINAHIVTEFPGPHYRTGRAITNNQAALFQLESREPITLLPSLTRYR